MDPWNILTKMKNLLRILWLKEREEGKLCDRSSQQIMQVYMETLTVKLIESEYTNINHGL